VRVGELGGVDALVVGRVELAVADVVHDGAREEIHVLQHDAERVAQIRLADVVDVDAVVADLAVGDVVEAVDEVRDRGLAGAGRADEGQFLAGLGEKRNIVQDGLALLIGKVDVEEAHVALKGHEARGHVVLRRIFPGPVARVLGAFDGLAVFHAAVDERHGAVVLLRLLVEQGEDAVRTRDGHGHGVDLLRDLRDVRGELLGHAEIGGHDGDGQGSGHRACGEQILEGEVQHCAVRADDEAADERGQHVENVADVHHDRHEDVAEAVGMLGVVAELVVELVERLFGRALVAEDLDDLLAVHHFLDIALGLAERLLLAHEERGRLAADALCDAHHGDDAEDHDQHERDAVIDHDEQHAGDGQSRGEQLRQAL